MIGFLIDQSYDASFRSQGRGEWYLYTDSELSKEARSTLNATNRIEKMRIIRE